MQQARSPPALDIAPSKYSNTDNTYGPVFDANQSSFSVHSGQANTNTGYRWNRRRSTRRQEDVDAIRARLLQMASTLIPQQL
eukprot:jgi/Chrzof1/923/Cz01g33220.t1